MPKRTEAPEIALSNGSNGYATFQEWTGAYADRMKPHYKKHGFDLPENLRAHCGFGGGGRRSRMKGETWHAATSDDKAYEIFIQPDIDDPVVLAGILTHEHIRAMLPPDAKLGKLFERAALTIGMNIEEGLRHCRPGKVLLEEVIRPILADLGDVPRKKLNVKDYNPDGTEWKPLDKLQEPQPTRMRKCSCPVDGCPYKLRMTHLYIEHPEFGPPECPKHRIQMKVEPEKNKTGEAGPLLEIMEGAGDKETAVNEGGSREKEADRAAAD